ncbi:MAG: hypothetical protein ABFD89_17595 [Bryobacteraceae bacterium]
MKENKRFEDQDPFAQLQWYLIHGASLFERSPTGAVLEMASMRMFVSRKCVLCERIYTGEGEDEWYATGIVGPDIFCPVCMGPCQVTWEDVGQQIRTAIKRQARDTELAQIRRELEAHVRPGSWCPLCKGMGVRPARKPEPKHLDARPTHFEHVNSRHGIDDERVIQFSLVSRRIATLTPMSAQVLGQLWGPPGAWCLAHNRPRYWAAAILVPSGIKLLRSSKRDEFDRSGPLGWLTLKLTECEVSSDPKQGAVFDAADSEAKTAGDAAEADWLKVCGVTRREDDASEGVERRGRAVGSLK